VACLALGTLAACGSGDPNGSGLSTIKAHKPKKARTGSAEADLANMVAAVTSAKSGPPVEMKFVLGSRPELGREMDVDVALIPRDPVPESVSAVFQAQEGMEIVEGAQLDRVDKLSNGAPVHHVVKIRPQRDGIFTLTATVTYEQEKQDFLRTFSIPVIAGEGVPEQVAKGP
jgi:hypothetical protein